MHHNSISNFPKLFRDTHDQGELPVVTPDIIARTRMDGGIDCIPGHHPKKRARILPDGVEPQELGLDDHYLPVGARSASLPSKGAEAEAANRASAGAYPRRGKVTLRGNTCTSFA